MYLELTKKYTLAFSRVMLIIFIGLNLSYKVFAGTCNMMDKQPVTKSHTPCHQETHKESSPETAKTSSAEQCKSCEIKACHLKQSELIAPPTAKTEEKSSLQEKHKNERIYILSNNVHSLKKAHLKPLHFPWIPKPSSDNWQSYYSVFIL